MNAIIGFSGLLEKNLQNEEKAKEYLGKICSSGNLLMTIINQILEIARIESGTTALQLKAEDINTLFHTVNTVFEVRCKEEEPAVFGRFGCISYLYPL